MDNLSYCGLKVDLELKKKLAALIDLKERLESLVNSEKGSPSEILQAQSDLQKVDDTIGKIRFHSLDSLNILGESNIESLPSKDEATGVNPGESSSTSEAKPEENKTISKSESMQVFGNDNLQTAELNNQVGVPIKVRPKVLGGDDVEKNSEPFFAKEFGFNPEQDEDSFYASLDEALDIEKMAHLISPEHNLPRGTKSLAEKSELQIYRGLRNTVNKWFEGVEKTTDPYHALADLKMSLIGWNTEAKDTSSETVQKLYDLGLQAGIQKGLKVPQKNVSHLIHKTTGIGPALDNFRDECYKNLSSIVKQHIHDGEHSLYREKRHLDSWLRSQRSKTRMMMKTEVCKIANLGLLESWGMDDDKYKYEYLWEMIDDDRTKDISRLRKSYNPLTYEECSFLWKNQEQLMPNGKFSNDTFNQRCRVARQRIDKEFTGNRFIGREAEFKQTM